MADPTIHLEGMGLQGALLAHRLARYGVQFTWHDIDRAETAWKASTGAIYPADSTNHGPDRECWKIWQSWYDQEHFSPNHLEEASGMVFVTKNPPHGNKNGALALFEGQRITVDPSYHFNAQQFVPAMRERFSAQRRIIPPHKNQYDRYIVTHGWGSRLSHVYWGWTRQVTLDYSALFLGNGPRRPSFYVRPNRFQMAYAYPVPGTVGLYYAGSNIIKQKLTGMKDYDPLPKYEKWKEVFERYLRSDGNQLVKVKHEGDFLTGWRPAAAEDDKAWVRVKGNQITLRPLWNSGIRHFPAQWTGVAPLLGLVP